MKISYFGNTWGGTLVAMPDVRSSLIVRCDYEHDELLMI